MNSIALPSYKHFAVAGILLALIATHVVADLADFGTAFAQSPKRSAETGTPSVVGNPVDSGGFARPSGVTPAISGNVTPAFRGNVTPAFGGSVAPALSSNPTPPVGAATDSSTTGAVPSSRASVAGPDSGGPSSSSSVDAGDANTTVGTVRAAGARDAGSAAIRSVSGPAAIDPANTGAEGNDRDIEGIEAGPDDDPDFVIVGNRTTMTNSRPAPQFSMICRGNVQSGCNPPPTFIIEER
jgi:hypothetical protein